MTSRVASPACTRPANTGPGINPPRRFFLAGDHLRKHLGSKIFAGGGIDHAYFLSPAQQLGDIIQGDVFTGSSVI